MLFLQTPSPEVTLRELTVHDAPHYFSAVDASKEHLSQYGDNTAEKYPDVNAVAKSITEPNDPTKLRMGIWNGDSFVGSANLTPDGVDAEISYWLDVRHTGNGFASLAVAGITGYGLARYAYLKASTHVDNHPSQAVLERSGYVRSVRKADQLPFGYQGPRPSSRLPIGVMKRNASDGSGRGTDSHLYNGTEVGFERMIKAAAGKKDKAMQRQLYLAVEYIQGNPLGDGSRMIRGLGGVSGQRGTPTFGHRHVDLWRFKPAEAKEMPTKLSALRNTRIVYALLKSSAGPEAIGILDVISRGDFEKEYD